MKIVDPCVSIIGDADKPPARGAEEGKGIFFLVNGGAEVNPISKTLTMKWTTVLT